MELTILMPCLNEAETLAECINKAKKFIQAEQIIAEILIADNGSQDGSQQIAKDLGARVVNVSTRGYGAALIEGINAAKGKYIIMGDADDSYNFRNLKLFLEKLRADYDLVMGNRFKGGIEKGAMPFLHKFLGNPVLSGIGRLLFKSPIKDFHCGLRGFSREAIQKIQLEMPGMEFASEMVVKATLHKLKITEVPTTLSPDGRNRPPHLRRWHDGWRHLKFLFLYAPNWLFLYPGFFLFLFGLAGLLRLTIAPVTFGKYTFDTHAMLYMGAFVNIGLQTISFSLFTKYYYAQVKFICTSTLTQKILSFFTLERCIILSLILAVIGTYGSIDAFLKWSATSFGQLKPASLMRELIPSLVSLMIGVQLFFSGFFLDVIRQGEK